MRQVRFNYWAINTGPQLPFVKIDNIVVFFQWHQPDPTPTALSAQNAITTIAFFKKRIVDKVQRYVQYMNESHFPFN